MTKTVDALYDGQVLRLEEPLNLSPNTRVRVTIESPETEDPKGSSFLATARGLNLEGPPDWSDRIEDFLYGNKVDDID